MSWDNLLLCSAICLCMIFGVHCPAVQGTLEIVQESMGHTVVKTTRRYTQV